MTATATTRTLPAAVPERRARGVWRDAWGRLREDRVAVASAVLIALLVLVAIFAGVLAPFGFDQQDLDSTDLPPTAAHPFGTDSLGRDLLSRLVYGSRISLAVGLVDVAVVLGIGVTLGLIAGYVEGVLGAVIMRTVDVLLAFPSLLVVIVVMTYLRAVLDVPHEGITVLIGAVDKVTGGLIGVFLALGLVSWLTVARLVRAQVLSLKQLEYVLAAKTIGAAGRRIMFRHLLPNTMAPIIVAATFGIPTAIAAEAGLSFLGIGVRPPFPSWGILIAEGVPVMRTYPHELLFPAGALALTLVCFSFLGDGLRDALDPRLQR